MHSKKRYVIELGFNYTMNSRGYLKETSQKMESSNIRIGVVVTVVMCLKELGFYVVKFM